VLQTAVVCAWGSVQGSYAWRKVESQSLDKLRSCFWFGKKKFLPQKATKALNGCFSMFPTVGISIHLAVFVYPIFYNYVSVEVAMTTHNHFFRIELGLYNSICQVSIEECQ